MSRLRRIFIAVSGLALVGGATALVAPNATAATLACGSVITSNTTLSNDVGPCPGDGLIVRASNIRLDLNGHRVIGSNAAPKAPQQVGIHLMNVSGVTVQNGEVRNFDAGVGIEGGSGNLIRYLYVHDNINHDVLTGSRDVCNFGDGIAIVGSSNNRVVTNRVEHNGPLSGISMVGNSDSNQVMDNQVAHNNVPNLTPAGTNSICGTGVGPMQTGREVQDIGVRMEGPGANNNRVQNNVVTDSALVGISVHGYVCHPPNGGPSAPSNDGNTIQGNQVTQTGRATHTLDPMADGIAVLEQGPAGVVCVSSNTTIQHNNSSNNFRHGVFIGGRGSHDNKVVANTVTSNAQDGISLTGPSGAVAGTVNNQLNANQGHANGRYDGADYNPGCDNNKWRGNKFDKVNQPCVSGP